ncbi:MAG: sigma-70 family RNA polymerase sigma factor [Lachnospiraceae bacterium]|nr:sigma-70 family RNA polymerase sigma factor [Lachnospiraceae bacterium]
MNDNQIVELYFQRDETAISETSEKYGGFCLGIAKNILGNSEDAEECVNDTWLKAWGSIPPARPRNLRAWLGKVVKRLALDRWRKNHAKKRGADGESTVSLDQILDELDDCVPSGENVESEMDRQELTFFLNSWLRELPEDDCVLFLKRYWNGDPVKALAEESGETVMAVTMRLYRLRVKLRKALEESGLKLG